MQKIYTQLVTLPPRDITTYGRGVYKAACLGEDGVAILLNYFVFEATKEANRDGEVNLDTLDCVTITRDEKAILKGINENISKPTLIKYRRKLEEYGFIVARPYQQEYDVYFKKIAEAVANPPDPPKRKPRGRHNPKSKSLTLESKDLNPEQSKDFTFKNGEVKSLLSAQSKDFTFESKELNEEAKVKTLTLESKTFNFESKTFNFWESRIAALEEALGKATERIDYLEGYIRLVSNTNVLDAAQNAKTDDSREKPEGKEKSSNKRGKTTSSKVVSLEEKKAEKSGPPAIVLTEKQREVYDAWAAAPWFRGIPPKITETVKGHCETIATEWARVPTTEEIEKCKNWAVATKPERYKLPNGKKKSFELGNLVYEYPNFLNATYETDPEPEKKSPPAPTPSSEQPTLFDQSQTQEKPGPDLVYWTLEGKITSQNWLTWGYMPFEEAQKLNLKYKTSAPPSLKRDTIQSKKATACKALGLLDEFMALPKDEQWKPLTEWVKQFQTAVTA